MTLAEAFDYVRSQLDAPTVAARYGLVANRAGYCHCPLHEDRTPSLRLYSGAARGFYCFSCHRGGSAIDLAQILLGLDTPTEALKALDRDFSLGLNLSEPMTAEQRQRADQAAADRQRRQAVAAAIESWRWSMAGRIADTLRRFDQITAAREPTSTEAAAFKWYDRLDNDFEVLLSGDPDTVIELYATDRERLEKQCLEMESKIG